MSIRDRPLDVGICMVCREERPGVYRLETRYHRDGTAYQVQVASDGRCLFCRSGVVQKVGLAC